MTTTSSILLLQGDAEASLLADGEVALQAVFPDADVQFIRAWATRPDWLGDDASAPPAFVADGAAGLHDVRELLAQPHRLVVFSLFPSISVPALRDRDGGAFLAHAGLRASWSDEQAARVAAECTELPALAPEAAAAALEPVIEALLARGVAVAVTNAFRRVREPLEFRGTGGQRSLRERLRALNLEIARLSQRTGCFVLDFDRPLAQEGGAPLDADCYGGGERAAEIALDEFAALVLDALPDGLPSPEAT
ncbi:MAG: hypothetical protein RL684_1694 [Pseudomonadota bacterium]|jgi:hypothetical protein